MPPFPLNSSILQLGRRRCRLPRFGAQSPISVEQGNATLLTKHSCFSTMADFVSKFAVVDHSIAYESAMRGRHGQQLALAKLEGKGKDDKPFDPFLEMERRKNAEETGNLDGVVQDDDVVHEDEDVQEAEVEESDDDESESTLPAIYNSDGSLRRKKSQLATLRAGFPAGGLFAIIHVNGFQHKVAVHDIVVVDRLKPLNTWKVGSTHTLRDILLISSSHLTLVGMPMVAGAEVDVMVEEITRDAKVIVFKKRRRKNSQRKNGFRRDVSVLRVLDIRMPDAYRDHRHIEPDVQLRPLETEAESID